MVELIHEGKVKTAHLTVGFFFVVKDPPAFDSASASTEDDDRQLSGVMAAGEHARTIEQHGIIEQGAFAFLDAVELARDVSDLLQEKLIHLQPIGSVAVREQMVDHVIDTKVWKTK